MLSNVDILIVPEGDYENRVLFLKEDAVVIVMTNECAENAKSDRYALNTFRWSGAELASALRLKFFPLFGCSRQPGCVKSTDACGLHIHPGHVRGIFELLRNPNTDSDLILEDRLRNHPDQQAIRCGAGYALDGAVPQRPPCALVPWCGTEAS